MRFTRKIPLLVVALVGVVAVSIRSSSARSSRAAQFEQDYAGAKMCEVTMPTAEFSVPYVSKAPELNTEPRSKTWEHAASVWIEKDCSRQFDYPKLKTEVRAFWTDTDLYLLFVSPYTELNLWLPADNSKDHLKLWDRDVVEFFLGDDWANIKRYKEFEIAPTGDWVDLD